MKLLVVFQLEQKLLDDFSDVEANGQTNKVEESPRYDWCKRHISLVNHFNLSIN